MMLFQTSVLVGKSTYKTVIKNEIRIYSDNGLLIGEYSFHHDNLEKSLLLIDFTKKLLRKNELDLTFNILSETKRKSFDMQVNIDNNLFYLYDEFKGSKTLVYY